MRIAELFHSIQGEGKLTGTPSAFIRASGCNLRCVWCDTPYASWDPQGDVMSVEQISAEVLAMGTKHVVITGGEPMIMPDIEALCDRLHGEGMHVTVETAATVFKPAPMHLASLSPKLANSTPHSLEAGKWVAMHEKARLNYEVIQQFIDFAPEFQLKFVIAKEGELGEIERILQRLHGWEPADVLLMPEGTDVATLESRAGWLAEVCKRTGFRYCPRLHIQLFGNTRGT